jgi:hypothetical protein
MAPSDISDISSDFFGVEPNNLLFEKQSYFASEIVCQNIRITGVEKS